MKIFVGNLAAKTAEQDLALAFEAFGEVDKINIARTSDDGLSRGFGFIDMSTISEANAAIAALNGSSLHGQELRVNRARRRTEDN